MGRFLNDHQALGLLLCVVVLWSVLLLKFAGAGSFKVAAILATLVIVIFTAITIWQTVWGHDAWFAFLVLLTVDIAALSFWDSKPSDPNS
jgi:hypothetical protein